LLDINERNIIIYESKKKKTSISHGCNSGRTSSGKRITLNFFLVIGSLMITKKNKKSIDLNYLLNSIYLVLEEGILEHLSKE